MSSLQPSKSLNEANAPASQPSSPFTKYTSEVSGPASDTVEHDQGGDCEETVVVRGRHLLDRQHQDSPHLVGGLLRAQAELQNHAIGFRAARPSH